MRKRFEPQLTLGSTPIEQILIPTKCRDEFPQFLRTMQYVYMNKEFSEQIFKLLESIICTKQPTGRKGMDLWTIFVLAGARQCLNTERKINDLIVPSGHKIVKKKFLQGDNNR